MRAFLALVTVGVAAGHRDLQDVFSLMQVTRLSELQSFGEWGRTPGNCTEVISFGGADESNTYFNLGGLGPDNESGEPQEIRLSSIGTDHATGVDFDLVIQNTTAYKANDAAKNNKIINGGTWVQINSAPREATTMEVSFVRKGTSTPLELHVTKLTLCDIDFFAHKKGMKNVSEEYRLTANAFYFTEDEPEFDYSFDKPTKESLLPSMAESTRFIRRISAADGVSPLEATVKATVDGDGCDNPSSPDDLINYTYTEDDNCNAKFVQGTDDYDDYANWNNYGWVDQAKRCLMFELDDSSGFQLEFITEESLQSASVAPATAGRNLMLGAASAYFDTAEPCPTPGPTPPPSATPTAPPTTAHPTAAPSMTPTSAPTGAPTAAPSLTPTSLPTSAPSMTPTGAPTSGPTAAPSMTPTGAPTGGPTAFPSMTPTSAPTGGPTAAPSKGPTSAPTGGPTAAPSMTPTGAPTGGPTAAPSMTPTSAPTDGPTAAPSKGPTSAPTGGPTASPSMTPTSAPTGGPTASPSMTPTSAPTGGPTASPSMTPTSAPTGGPTSAPSMTPTGAPTGAPSAAPSMTPTSAPTGGPTAGEVTGDPHVTNVEGQRFNLARVGVHTLLRLPRFSDPSPARSALPALLEVNGSVESEESCVEPFVKQLDLSGLWLRQSGPLVLRAGGLNEDSKGAIMLQVNGSHVGVDELSHDARLRGLLQVTKANTKHGKPHGGRVHRNKFFTVKFRFSGATLTVDWVHREVPGSTLNHLDLHVADLPRLEKGIDVGGILGRDDHASAASASPGCEPTENLVHLHDNLDVSGSLLRASYEK